MNTTRQRKHLIHKLMFAKCPVCGGGVALWLPLMDGGGILWGVQVKYFCEQCKKYASYTTRGDEDEQ